MAPVPPAHLRDTVAVRGLELRMHAGIDAWGRAVPQPVHVDAVLRTDVAQAGQCDHLPYSHNYGVLYRAIEALGTAPAGTNLAQVAEGAARACTTECHAPWAEVQVRLPRALLRARYVGLHIVRTPTKYDALRASDHLMLHGIEAFAILGVNPWERVDKQRIVMDVDVWPPRTAPAAYRAIVRDACECVEASSFLTIESLATHVAHQLLQAHAMEQVRVRIDKPSAIMHAQCSSVQVVRDRAFFALPPAVYTDTAVPVALALGANLGHRAANLHDAVRRLAAHPAIEVLDTSFLYETAPMYLTEQPRFLNGACKIQTTLTPHELLQVCQQVERDVGRVKEGVPRNGPRAVDVDIVLYGSEVVADGEHLIVPHPRLAERPFVLYPLCDVWPDAAHPQLRTPVRTLLPPAPPADMARVLAWDTHLWAWGARTLVMGILNATPDSFSDGGRHNDVGQAIATARDMVAAGAHVLDIGGQSTAPGHPEVPVDEEMRRVLPLIRALRADPETQHVPISIDTYRADVARAALDAGASLVNDVSGGTRDPSMLPLVADRGCPYILMHMRGDALTMTRLNTYEGGVVPDVTAELEGAVARAIAAGVPRWNVVVDPGMGFAKDTPGNLALLRGLRAMTGAPAGELAVPSGAPRALRHMPVLLGVSRKRFLRELLAQPEADEAQRDRATMAAVWISAYL
ncbi:trifunctional dihydropteroate synthetase [Malassezia caprae]|uniref:Trifunctional dihydropteroate synthetase n=1 Tax=Malassezia caprae TaxID=1381934 RepID=A0AAF0E5D9_9BASI|nr:trifunctional dihydropteroate synthetase [Malassezia caprae]